MKDEHLEHELRRSLNVQRPAARDACPGPEALVALVERRGSEDDRLRVLNHTLTCADCSEELELLRAMRATQRRPVLQPRTLALAAALLLAVAISVWRLTLPQTESVVRAGTESVVLVTPRGNVRSARVLTWHAVPNASQYAVELRREDGTFVLQDRTTDTTLALPESVTLPKEEDLYWTVSARLVDGSDVRATPRRFRIQSP